MQRQTGVLNMVQRNPAEANSWYSSQSTRTMLAVKRLLLPLQQSLRTRCFAILRVLRASAAKNLPVSCPAHCRLVATRRRDHRPGLLSLSTHLTAVSPFETFVPGVATSMPHVREAEANLPEADARPPGAVLDDAADRPTGSDAQKTVPANLRTIVALQDVNGPLRTLASRSSAAVQLHQTGHRCLAQHFVDCSGRVH